MHDWNLDILKTEGNDFIRWKSLINQFQSDKMDLHYTPEYAQIYEKTFDQDIELIVFGDQYDFILMTIVKTDLSKLPFIKEGIDQFSGYDIESIYGYGGPLAHFATTDVLLHKSLFSNFWSNYQKYCNENRIIDEYIRFHPLLENHRPIEKYCQVEVKELKPVVYINLTDSEDNIWNGVNRGHRSSINKARRSGVTVSALQPDEKVLQDFQILYNETMDRNEADEIWQLTPEYFQTCVDCLGKEHVTIFNAEFEEKMIASYFVIHGYSTAYYHFGGSQEASFDLRANNLLIYEIAMWAKTNGYKWLHLGGGITPADGLYRFKSGFSKTTALLYSANIIHNQASYDQLSELKSQWNSVHQIDSKMGYFPAYKG